MSEHHLTTTCRPKFWRNNPLPVQPSWTPKRPLRSGEPRKQPSRSKGVRKQKDARNRRLCQARAQGASMADLAREFDLHLTRVRQILNENMVPEEIVLDEVHTHKTRRFINPGEERRALDLRRSGMKLKEVAKEIGRSVTTTLKLLRAHMPAEELTRISLEGRSHRQGKYFPARAETRPKRQVVSVAEVGTQRVYTLACGHTSSAYRSKTPRPLMWRLCDACLGKDAE